MERGTHWVDSSLNAHKDANLPWPCHPYKTYLSPTCQQTFQRSLAPQRPSSLRIPSSMANPACQFLSEGGLLKQSPSSRTGTLNAVTPATDQPARLIMANRIALPAWSITMVTVQLRGQHDKEAVHLVAPEQWFGEYLVIPGGLGQTPTKSWW